MALYKGSIRLAGIGSFPDQIQYMSQDDYNALSEEAKMNGTTYGIVGETEPSNNLELEFDSGYTVTLDTTRSSGDNVIEPVDYDRFIIIKVDSNTATGIAIGLSSSATSAQDTSYKINQRFVPAGYYGYITVGAATTGTVYTYKFTLPLIL